ncbi:MAG: hypothetical protein HY696_07505 [Deltaproteobacteria bacterium]|nr:hypothetical protein [Deltaproteobacteria bacterium]
MPTMSVVGNRRGSAALMAMLGLLLLGGMGATAVSLVSTGEETRATSHASELALGLAQAGVEFGKNRIDQGLNPAVANMPFGQGTFTVVPMPNTSQLAATGAVGLVRRNFLLTTQYAKDCGDLNFQNAHSAGKKIEGAKLLKNCLSKATITQWNISWAPDAGEKTVKLQVQGDAIVTLYDNPAGFASGTTIDATDYVLTKGPGVPEPINKIEFDTPLPAGKTYTVTLFFSDGSSVTRSFLDAGGGPPE